jgi:hypothetical protein
MQSVQAQRSSPVARLLLHCLRSSHEVCPWSRGPDKSHGNFERQYCSSRTQDGINGWCSGAISFTGSVASGILMRPYPYSLFPYARQVGDCLSALADRECLLWRLGPSAVREDLNSSLKFQCDFAGDVARDLDLKLAFVMAQRVKQELDGNYNCNYLAMRIHELRSRMQDDLASRQFLYIPPDRIEFFGKKDLFGKQVSDKFCDSLEDIEQAGNCLALNQNTACVFHLMRGMEAAVKELGTALGIGNVDKEWGKILSDIDSAINEMPKGRRRDEWSASRANLYHVKQASRNNTMHPKNTYTAEQAKEIFSAVKAFMSQLAALI